MLASISSKFTSFCYFLKPKRKLGLVSFIILFGLAAGMWFVMTQIAWASPLDWALNIVGSILLTIAELFIKITIFILKFVIELGSYNGYITSRAVTVGWVMVRDVTNMFFVIILLVIAFGTILGIEKYEWKKLMVKLILAAVLVNFSRIIAGVIIDVAYVIMVTFINGVAATAGGNLISMFSIDEIMKLGNEVKPEQIAPSGVFMACVAALAFSAMMMATMAVYLIMLLARMVMLWVLIVLSPLAFVLSVVPQTEKYASQWWTEFGNNVVSGPIIAFFLWLSFVTVGAGDIHTQIMGASDQKLQQEVTAEVKGVPGGEQAGISKALSWTNLANFAIAIGMLIAGAKMAQQLGAAGGAMMGKAVDFGKKAAMIGSGIAAGRWAAKKGLEAGKKAGKAVGKGLYAITLANTVERAKNWGVRQYEGYKDWRAMGPRIKRTEMKAGEQLTEVEKARGVQMGIGKDGKQYKYDFERDEEGNVIDTRGRIQKALHNRQERLLGSRKNLKKVQEQRELREKLMDKRVTASPKYLMQRFEGEEGTFRYDALDRIEKGQLAAEEERSEAKTTEFAGIGRAIIKSNDRFKDGKFQTGKGTISEQIQAHKAIGEMIKGKEERGAEKNRAAFFEKNKWVARAANEAEIGKQMASEFIKELQAGARRGLLGEALGQQYIGQLARSKAMQEGLTADEEKNLLAEQRLQIDQGEEAMGVAATPIEAEITAVQNVEGALSAGQKSAGLRQLIAENNKKMIALEELATDPAKADTEEGKKAISEYQAMEQQNQEAEKEAAALEEQAGMLRGGKPQNFDKLVEQMEKLSQAMEKVNKGEMQPQEMKGFIDSQNKDSSFQSALKIMFGKQQLDDSFFDKRNSDVLNQVLGQLRQAKGSGDTLGGVRNSLVESRGRLGHVWEETGLSNPALYAAQQLAHRDHNYTFYRGRRQEMIDKAAQASIWGKMNIEVPSSAANEVVVEGLYKHMKDMNYNQSVAAHRGHLDHVAQKVKKGGKADYQDKMVAQALLKKLFDESWIDDATMATYVQEWAKLTGGNVQQMVDQIRRRSVGGAMKPNLDQLGAIKKFVGKNIDAKSLQGIKNFDTKIMNDIKEKLKSIVLVEKTLSDQGIENIDKLMKMVRSIDDDQLKELIAAAKT